VKYAAKDLNGNWLFDLDAADKEAALAEAKKRNPEAAQIELVSENERGGR
jgi:hypothetical protein